MKTVNIYQAKSHLSRLIDEALNSETIVIARRNKPLIRLVPEPSPGGRKIGTAAGQVEMAEDFDAIPKEFKDYT